MKQMIQPDILIVTFKVIVALYPNNRNLFLQLDSMSSRLSFLLSFHVSTSQNQNPNLIL